MLLYPPTAQGVPVATLPVATFSEEDPHGTVENPEWRPIYTERRKRRMAHRRINLIHRVKNGVYDPLTYYHLIDFLMTVVPDQWYRAVDLTEYLNGYRPAFVWDTTTVGRILNDLVDTFLEMDDRLRFNPILRKRAWNGTHYAMTDFPEARTLMMGLLEDLGRLSEEYLTAEASEGAPKRLDSPLRQTPTTANLVSKTP